MKESLPQHTRSPHKIERAPCSDKKQEGFCYSAAQNLKVYTAPQGRESTFAEPLSRNRKASAERKFSLIFKHFFSPTRQTINEDSDGEGATLDRPLTSLEKLHIIVGYAIVRPDLR